MEKFKIFNILREIPRIILETLHEKEMPSGHLYVAMMNHIDIDSYQAVIQGLKDAGLITTDYHLLVLTEKGKQQVERTAK